MKEINYKDMTFNPFNLIGGEWMLVTAWLQEGGTFPPMRKEVRTLVRYDLDGEDNR